MSFLPDAEARFEAGATRRRYRDPSGKMLDLARASDGLVAFYVPRPTSADRYLRALRAA
jgi:hypothetical protein